MHKSSKLALRRTVVRILQADLAGVRGGDGAQDTSVPSQIAPTCTNEVIYSTAKTREVIGRYSDSCVSIAPAC
jgi:hypothetical protein